MVAVPCSNTKWLGDVEIIPIWLAGFHVHDRLSSEAVSGAISYGDPLRNLLVAIITRYLRTLPSKDLEELAH